MKSIVLVLLLLLLVSVNGQFCCIDCPIEDWSECETGTIPITSSFICHDDLVEQIVAVSDSLDILSISSSCISLLNNTNCSSCFTGSTLVCPTVRSEAVNCYCNMSNIKTIKEYGNKNNTYYNSSSFCSKSYGMIGQVSNVYSSRSMDSRGMVARSSSVPSVQSNYNSSQYVSTSLKDQVLTVFIQGFTSTATCLTDKDHIRRLFPLNNSQNYIPLPAIYFQNSGLMSIVIQDGNKMVYEEEMQIYGKSYCEFNDCPFYECPWDAITWVYDCTTHDTKKYTIYIILIILTLASFCIPCVQGFIIAALSLLLSIFVYCFSGVYDKVNKHKEKRKLEMESAKIKKDEKEEIISEALKMYRERKETNNLIMPMIFLLIGFSFLQGVAAYNPENCDFGSVITTTPTYYTNGSSSKIAGTPVSVRMTLQTQDFQTCLVYRDGVTGEVLFMLNARYAGLQVKVPLSKIYFTSGWNMVSVVNHRCSCNITQCLTMDYRTNLTTENGILTADSLANNVATKYPGVSGCASGCNFATLCCPTYDPSCINFREAIVPIVNDFPGICKASLPTSLIFTPTVNIRIFGPAGKLLLSDTVSGVNGNVYNFFNNTFNLQFQGLYQQTITEFSNKKVYLCSGAAYIVDANDVGTLVAGQLGDIQANDPTLLSRSGISNFNFATDIFLGANSVDGENMIFRTSVPGISRLGLYKPLPQIYGNNLFSISPSGDLLANVTSPGALDITINSVGNFNVSLRVNPVCPTISSVNNASGCYQCTAGFVVYITAKSICSAGLAYVSLFSLDTSAILYTNAISLTNQFQSFAIRGSTVQQKNNLKIIISNGEYSDSRDISFRAVSINLVGNQTFNQTGPDSYNNGNVDDNGVPYTTFSANPIKAIENLFHGIYCEEWYQYLYNYIYDILCLVLFTILVLFIVFIIFELIVNVIVPLIPSIYRAVVSFTKINKLRKNYNTPKPTNTSSSEMNNNPLLTSQSPNETHEIEDTYNKKVYDKLMSTFKRKPKDSGNISPSVSKYNLF